MSDRPSNVSEIGVPPKEYSQKNQRCNRAGQPMFYCSDHPSAPLAEVGVKVGDRVVISQWITTKPLLVMQVGYSQETFDKLGIRKPRAPEWMNVPDTIPRGGEESHREVNSYLSDLFTERVPDGDEHLYVPSIAIAEAILSYDPMDHLGLFPEDPDMKAEGIIYPTVALRASCENLALRAEFAHEALLLEAADFVEVVDIDPQSLFKCKYLGSVTAWRHPGLLLWGNVPFEKRVSGWQVLIDEPPKQITRLPGSHT